MAIWSLLLAAACGVVGDATWTRLGQPNGLSSVFAAGPLSSTSLACLLIATIAIRIACFAILAFVGLRVASTSRPSTEPVPE